MKTPTTALIVVDVQRDFMTGGALAVPLPGQDLPAAETNCMERWHDGERLKGAIPFIVVARFGQPLR